MQTHLSKPAAARSATTWGASAGRDGADRGQDKSKITRVKCYHSNRKTHSKSFAQLDVCCNPNHSNADACAPTTKVLQKHSEMQFFLGDKMSNVFCLLINFFGWNFFLRFCVTEEWTNIAHTNDQGFRFITPLWKKGLCTSGWWKGKRFGFSSICLSG